MSRPSGIFKKPPVLVPAEAYDHVMSLSKAALADMAWDFAQRIAASDNSADIMRVFNQEWDAVKAARDAQ